MDVFKDFTFTKIVKYEEDQLIFVRDLMKAGLLNPVPPVCHDDMVVHGADPWHWRCVKRDCSKKNPVVTGSFLDGKRKYISVFKALYLWAQGHAIKNIVREAGIGQDTLRKLVTEWRSLVCDKESPKLGGDGILVEADEVAIGSRKYQKGKRQRIGGVQWVRHFLFRRFLFFFKKKTVKRCKQSLKLKSMGTVAKPKSCVLFWWTIAQVTLFSPISPAA